uniref:alpha-glucan, water dikinase n=1 Tax=Kalanchoe fedtschenkoi TaxID=63787 RepID=A0A089WW83_KALFE|nr:glucan water dikinase [Kalanchoe fedtschenkoi]
MSTSIGQGHHLHKALLFPAVIRHQSKRTSSANTLFPVRGSSRTSILYSTFRGKGLKSVRSKLPMGTPTLLTVIPHAVLTTDTSSEQAVKFTLDGGIELQVDVSVPSQGSTVQLDFKVTNSTNSLILHWGGLHDANGKWVLPARRPDRTKVYKNKALQTPFVTSGSQPFLKLEIDDPSLQAIEFLIVDETKNKWFKNRGENFKVKLRQKEKTTSNLYVPEDLVQIQAYLRWERNGKQMYTPEQEKIEYEAARTELLEEVARGVSIQDLRFKLTKKNGEQKPEESNPFRSSINIPDDLVQTQAYIRWEKAGKPDYSADQELKEFEEARRELLMELDNGISIDELRKKIIEGEIETKVTKQVQKKKLPRIERIQRKKRDILQILHKQSAGFVENNVLFTPKTLTAIQLYTKGKEEQSGGILLNKKVYKLADKELLTLVTKTATKTKVHLATNYADPIILHWGVSRKPGEWLEPPSSIAPPDSVFVTEAIDTKFAVTSFGDPPCKIQYLDVEIEDATFVGMPFVLVSGSNWIKNNGNNFYIEFSGGPKQAQKEVGDGKGTARALLDKIAEMESEAQKSFMHRFNIAADLVDQAVGAGELGLAGILVWMRFMATRQLIWNKNYNVKPREISKAQDRLTDLLQNVYKSSPQYRELLRMVLSTVGRGGEGDVGQRIRDEILVIQRNNDCKGGMMEEWHQKLHNNTSPDDVIICQALIDYIKSDFDINAYWSTLNSNGITKERLLSYDRAIHSEPSFKREQKEGLLRDLGNYMRTLKAVHSGADLESAITNVMGYKDEGQGFMVGVQINPVSGLPPILHDLLRFVLEHVEDRNVESLLEGLLEARQELHPLLLTSNDRLKDLLFLDIALDSTVRTAIERGYEELNNAGPEKIMYFITLVLENVALSSDNNEDLVYCLKEWNYALHLLKTGDDHWALYAKSVLDRTRLSLTSKAEWYHQVLQPSAEYLGSLLGVDQWAIDIFTEEIIRAGSAASLSFLLNRLDPVLRRTANLGSWQVISPIDAIGYVVVVDELLAVQNKTYEKPTILIAKSVKGEEEIPDGVVAVLTPDMPDVLSHVSVRARNSKVCFATCFDYDILAELQSFEGKLMRLKPTSAEVVYSGVKEDELASTSSTESTDDGSIPSLTLAKKQFLGKYAISSEEFAPNMVGAKSRNISYLKGKVPTWVGIPTSVALPFGAFEETLADASNQAVADKLQTLKEKLGHGEFSALGEIRNTVLQLSAPPLLIEELKNKMKTSGMPWPGDEGKHRWEQAWTAIKKVWASKWNERAYFSTRKLKLDHDYLCMAVLVQEIINADYAFVIHTANPASGDTSEIYAEVVRGLGETLVGAYPGRALSFICKKSDLNAPLVLGYPSKPIGLFIKRSIIFRSDSNGEDLEGYAGAGLYDSVPMDEEEKVVLDYGSDPLIVDRDFRNSILCKIAQAGSAIEDLYGSPQDIEGVVRDGKIYVVQTRPQM